jgi:predicted enzyme related to lactoylglutathione lyase
MHRSRVWGVIIDCEDLTAGLQFWAQALGVGVQSEEDPFVNLEPTAAGLRIGLQRVPEVKAAKTRLHFDIETDNVEAEVKRLARLGAQPQTQMGNWWIMEDPRGNEFCVVPIQSDDFPASTHSWDI